MSGSYNRRASSNSSASALQGFAVEESILAVQTLCSPMPQSDPSSQAAA